MIKLSILICTIPKRERFYTRLMEQLLTQETDEVEILSNSDPKITIGEKRNELLFSSTGEYVCFIDDDDLIYSRYIELLFEGINKGVDCCSLKGIITEDGMNPLVFEHSIKYDKWRTIAHSPDGQVRYERTPNHLNCIKSSIAKQFRFPEINTGEDHDWSTQVFNSGLLKTEHYIPQVLYYYEYRSKK